jgi:glutaminyl-tRNA synthetase
MSDVATHFLRARIEADRAAGAYAGRVATRFPPEPNGYLHIGHAKSICLNFGLAAEYGGTCNLRFDDTNPDTEDVEYVDSIAADVRWLGFTPTATFYASDYFGFLYTCAETLVGKGLAYVDFSSDEDISRMRGTTTEPGTPSRWRDTPVEENLALLRAMRDGAYAEGHCVLRARIDLGHPNFKMRDPLLYRIKKHPHHRTGAAWCIYPFYDFAHCLSDAHERITHSICTLEFENNRELYDWILAACDIPEPPHQHEFARLNLTYTVLSKRKLIQLVREGHVAGWDDPRIPTLAGLRRRGVTPEALRAFCERIGIAKANSTVDVGLLDFSIREDLNTRAPRGMGVLAPLKLVLTDLPAPVTLEASRGDGHGSRTLTLGRELWIDLDDFRETPPAGWHRLAPGAEARLRFGPVVRVTEVVRDENGAIVALHATHDPATFGGAAPEGRKVKGVLHWVDAASAVEAEVRLYDRLFAVEEPGARTGNFLDDVNPHSLVTVRAQVEPGLSATPAGTHVQLERVGYFYADPVDSTPGRAVFNRVVGLKEGWTDARVEAPVAAPKTPSAPKESSKARELSPAVAAARDAWVAEGVPVREATALAQEPERAALVRSALSGGGTPAGVAAWVLTHVSGPLSADPRELGVLVARVDSGALTAAAARQVLARLASDGGTTDGWVRALDLAPITDENALLALVDRAIAAMPDQAARVRAGNAGLLGAFVGAVMKASDGRAHGPTVQRLLRERLG